MTEGLAAVLSRIGQLQALTGTGPAAAGRIPLGSSGSDFATSIAGLLPGTGTGGVTDGSGTDPAALGASAVTLARGYLGVPYRWGGTDPKTGLDCSGLVQLVYRRLGIDLPRTSQEQQHSGTEVPLDQARPGDLVFFGEPAHHVGIYVGDGKMIDAPHTGSVVGVHNLYGTPSHVRRVTGSGNGGAPGGSSALAAALAAAGLTTGLTTTGVTGGPGAAGAGAAGPAAGTGGLSGPYAELFTAAGRRYGVDPALLSAVARTESGYDPRAVSGAGAQGLMQLMPGTARALGVDARQPAQAVDGAARLLSGYLKTYHGRVDLALAAYNAGPGAVNRYGGVPPYTETQNYVRRVTGYWKALR